MRKLFNHPLLLVTFLLAGAGFFAMPLQAHALSFDIAEFLFGSVDVVYGILGKIFWWGLIPLASTIMALIGGIMDFALKISVTSSLYNNEAVSIAWTVIRDLTNMLFIFVLVYAGIQTILGIGNASKIKKTITSVVIAALLLNFSLFFTKVFIDVSNVTASWFIQGIQKIGGQESVSSSIRATLQMEKMTGTYGWASYAKVTSYTLTSFTQGILMFILMCVAIYVLYKIADLIIGRIVAFIILLITSPLGFTGVFLELGDLSTYAKKWWKEMTGQIFMLPMFFLMLYITMFLVDRFDKIIAPNNTAVAGGFEIVNYLMFVIIIMLLLKSLKVAEEYSGDIGTGFAKFAQQATGIVAGGIAMGTIGKGANALKNSVGFQKWSATSGVAGEMAMRAARNISSAEFGVKSSFSGLSKSIGADKAPLVKDAFKGADKGYSGKIDQEKKDLKEYVKSLGKGLPGAQNRKAYAENLESGLYNRVVSGGKGIVTGTINVGKAALNTAGNTSFKEVARGAGRLAKDTVVGVLNNQGIAGAKKEMLGESNKELAKEVGKKAQIAIAIVNDQMNTEDSNKSIKQLETDLINVNRQLDKNLNKKTDRTTNDEQEKQRLSDKSENIKNKIAKRKELIQKQIDELKKEGVTFKREVFAGTPYAKTIIIDENEEGLKELARIKKEIENEETAAKIAKIAEKAEEGDTEKPRNEKPEPEAPKAETKPNP